MQFGSPIIWGTTAHCKQSIDEIPSICWQYSAGLSVFPLYTALEALNWLFLLGCKEYFLTVESWLQMKIAPET
jgi:hypothetical protein